jgi:hypothetical protein
MTPAVSGPLVAGPEVTIEIGAAVVAAAHPATDMVGAAHLHSAKCAADVRASRSAADMTATEATTHMAATAPAMATPAPARQGIS